MVTMEEMEEMTGREGSRCGHDRICVGESVVDVGSLERNVAATAGAINAVGTGAIVEGVVIRIKDKVAVITVVDRLCRKRTAAVAVVYVRHLLPC